MVLGPEHQQPYLPEGEIPDLANELERKNNKTRLLEPALTPEFASLIRPVFEQLSPDTTFKKIFTWVRSDRCVGDSPTPPQIQEL